MLNEDGTLGVSIVIPAWNEEEEIASTLDGYLPPLEATGCPFEVIVVADGVRDRTAEIAAQYGNRNVRVLRFPSKLGKGGAVLHGLANTGYDRVGFVDADAPVAPSDLPRLAEGLDQFDCVIGSRRAGGTTTNSLRPLSRRIASWGWNALVRVIMALPVRDMQFGAKFFRRTALNRALPSVVLSDWAFDVSLLYHVHRTGGTIHELPVSWSHRREGHFSVVRNGPGMIASLLGLRLLNSRLRVLVPPTLVVGLAHTFSPHTKASALGIRGLSRTLQKQSVSEVNS